MDDAQYAIDEFRTAATSLEDAMRMPGLDGQAHIFARLEDLQQAMEDLRDQSPCFNSAQRQAAVEAVEQSRRTLTRLDGAFQFVERMLRERQELPTMPFTYASEQESPDGRPRLRRARTIELSA